MLVIFLNDVQNRNMIERLLHCIITKKTYVENEKFMLKMKKQQQQKKRSICHKMQT